MKKLFNKNQINKNKRRNAGFTLIETLVAVLVLTIALNGILTLITSSIFSARYAKNEITGMYLAQEAIDYVRNDRDSTVFHSGDTWDNFLTKYGFISSGTGASCFSSNGCQLDVANWETNSIKECNNPGGECNPIYYDDDTSKATSFTRKILMQVVSVGQGQQQEYDELVVTVIVNWKNGSLPHSQILTESFLNWQ